MECELFIANNNSMPCIIAAIIPAYQICFFCQEINYFALTLIAKLTSYNNYNLTHRKRLKMERYIKISAIGFISFFLVCYAFILVKAFPVEFLPLHKLLLP